MGAAVSLFDGAAAVCVPRDRFFPVKKCNDLLAVRSDRFVFSDKGKLVLNTDNRTDDIKIDLDSDYYKLIDDFNERFPDGAPSLLACESLQVKGDVRFEGDVVLKGRVRIENAGASQAAVANTTMEGDVVL